MNVIPALIGAWLFLGLETGLATVLGLGSSGIAPSFVLPLAVYFAMSAPPLQAVWACLLIGLCVDLTSSVTLTNGDLATVAGPYALGYVLMAQFVLTVRAMLIKRNPLTMPLLTLIGAVLVHLFVIAIFTVRNYYDGIVWDLGAEVSRRAAISGYTGLLALPLSYFLHALSGVFGFQQLTTRQFVITRRD